MTNKDLFEALRTFEKEKGIPMDYMLQNIEKAISVACKNYYGGNENVVFKVDPEKNSFDAKLVKTVVDEVFDPNFEVTVEEAQQINKRKKFIVGDEIEVLIDPQAPRLDICFFCKKCYPSGHSSGRKRSDSY